MERKRQRQFFVESRHQELRKLQDEFLRITRRGKYRDPDAELKDWIELEKPVRAGWEQTFELRDDVAARRDAHVFSEILDRINHSIRSHRKDFRYRRKAKQYETLEPELQIIRTEKWDLPDHYKKFFEFGVFQPLRDLGGRAVDSRYRSKIKGYRFGTPYFYQPVIRPFYATHRKIHRADRDSRIREIENKIEALGGWKILFKAYHDCNQGSYWWRGDRGERYEIYGRLEQKEGIREYLEVAVPRRAD
ncbi:MAG: hypothetical protein CMN76_16290 [Spirochaetaceae bacterium]|nr:hypothetical protein [Spirochaetaceae bacterium]|tara:strand:+ start:10042 stop:10785 length:744 start_codon:yes stop_codon:yes gene_type:complete